MWFIAKKNSLLSPDRTPIILHNVLINFEVLGSMGPRTSIHIGKKSKEGRACSYFLIFSSDALIAAKPHSLLGIRVQPSGRLPSCTEMPDGSFKTGIEALEKSRQIRHRIYPPVGVVAAWICVDVVFKTREQGRNLNRGVFGQALVNLVDPASPSGRFLKNVWKKQQKVCTRMDLVNDINWFPDSNGYFLSVWIQHQCPQSACYCWL
ncbi:hypothetical protein HELRODRAFT_172356 [Helobdella robusta]|uniref:Uncharacterized protein n=1 Tax=Helobdella robusta TaxID=6412 RepID=T1F579_HELRO|nr:hypothetical protein HELRODRAFT_172356 [Helobdella robusta]ESO04686.1 hypothetical protein HELRODRAFT_172356 [Helobdella robusta]